MPGPHQMIKARDKGEDEIEVGGREERRVEEKRGGGRIRGN